MGSITDSLRKEAGELQAAQDQLEWQQTKLAATQVLSNSGVPVEEANAILNGLEGQVKVASQASLKNFSHYSQTMIKSAALIDELEAKIAEKDAELSVVHREKQAGVISSLSSKGYEHDEIEQLISTLPKTIMEKVAGVSEAAWDMGRAVSNSNFTGNGQTDCVTEWLTRG